MLIKETIERECCNPGKDDLISVRSDSKPTGVGVCKYCGQMWARKEVKTTDVDDHNWRWERVKSFGIQYFRDTVTVPIDP